MEINHDVNSKIRYLQKKLVELNFKGGGVVTKEFNKIIDELKELRETQKRHKHE